MFHFLWLLLIVLCYKHVDTLICSRYPANTYTPKSPVDENYVISISGNPETYILGQEYNVSVNAYNGRRYISFILALENDNGEFNLVQDLGHFEVTDMIETRYSPNCINMVESTNTNPKTHSYVTWVAPSQPGNGCILIRATLLQHRDVWHMDDGGLTRRICEEIVDDVESKPISVDESECCACDEARYEVIFEGVWSRNLHPKDFPPRGWITRFGEIVGAAHTADYRFWEYGELATEGMRQYAEHGATQLLEQEFSANFKEGKIRTIIKARGPAFPNLRGRSVSSVRVDPQHHFISLASKIDPSPDWIVGVSGLELCLSNCTWLEQKIVNLYPWDVGTDAGPSYTSPDQPQVPPDVIRHMRSDFPNDPRSPFYREDGEPMKPMAKLIINRQRLYERLCEDEESNNIDVSRECMTHPWSRWSECTAKCGEGRQYRTRVYRQPEVARVYKCEVELRQERVCQGETCGILEENFGEYNEFESKYPGAECQISQWRPWGPCSRTCGTGRQSRRREYLNPSAEEKCQAARPVSLIEFRKCSGRNCLGEISNIPNPDAAEDELQSGYPNMPDEYNGYENNARNMPDEYNGLENRGRNMPDEHNGLENRGRNMPDEYNSYGRNMPDEYNGVENRGRNMPDEYNSYGNMGSNNRYGNELQLPEYTENNEQERRPYNRFEAPLSTRPNYYAPEAETASAENSFGIGNLNKGSIEYGFPEEPPKSRQRKPNSRQNWRPRPAEFKPEEITNEAAPPNERLADIQKSEWQQKQRHGNTIPNAYEEAVPAECFVALRIVDCIDPKVTGNYWFYNYCEDECMIYAADACDRNNNRYNSLEECEQRCRQPAYQAHLRQRQNSNECRRMQRTPYRARTNFAHNRRTYQRPYY